MDLKFSIITCTLNSAKFLKRNIESVKNQNYQNFEHIFIDGFSNDDTLKIIESYKNKFPDKVRVFKHKAKGISNAMNLGIKHASGDYLIHLHSDDSFYDDLVLMDVNHYLVNNSFDWIYGKILIRNEDFSKVGLQTNKSIFFKKNTNFIPKYILKFINFIPHQSVFIKKNVFNKFGLFDENLKSAMDPDLWLRIKNKTNWIFFDRVISNYCIRRGAQSSDKRNKKENKKNKMIVKKRYLNKIELIFSFFVDFLLKSKNKKNFR
ncbi:MAG: glycosyltransferase [Candidatus Pacebacteria bacterium]|nr:glycosyltransferase [Candidatus Paceibacterota bacterium]